MIKNSNFGLYIHVPFCRRKCIYCDFYLISNTNLIDEFVRNLLTEIKIYSDIYSGILIDSVFYGGGTPSLLNDKQIYNIQNALCRHFRVSDKCETTIEANPEDFIHSPERFTFLRNCGINRISFGVQSFNNETLKFLTRLHTAEEAVKVIQNAKNFFDNISIDMIYAVPYESTEDMTKSFIDAVSLGIPHISAYSLIYEKYTRLNMMYEQDKIIKKNPDRESEEYFIIYRKLSDAGFRQYEVSNYAKENFESVHNRKYWNYDNYIGLGPSAHSSVNGERWNNFRNIIKYNKALKNGLLPFEKKVKLARDEIFEEFIFLGLRSEGVNLEKFKILFKERFEEKFSKQIEIISKLELGELANGRFTLNSSGKIIADEIQLKYFSDLNP